MGRWIWLAALLGAIFVVAAQQVGYSNEVDKGFAWLQSQVQADGTVDGEDRSQALPLQVRTETLHTLALLESHQAGLADRIGGTPQKHTELQARQALALRLANRGAEQVIADLGLQQNTDGGFGSRQTYVSNPLDTAYALIALSSSPDADATRVAAALSYLRTAKLSQAGWSVGDHPSVYVTSAVLLAAQNWSSRYQVGDIVATARDWLLSQRSADDTFGNVLDNANALLAFTTQTSDETILHPLAVALQQAQLESGSWEEDPYVTAIVLRALYRSTSGLPPTTTGAIAGLVVDQGTKAPIEGVVLTVRESPEARVETAADGSFMLLGLSPGEHTIDIQALGYRSATFVATVTTGTTTNTGAIALEKTSLTAEVLGIVRNSWGTPLPNVVVSSGTVSSFTAADGSYSLQGLNAGAATITFAATGYRTLEVPLTLEAGGRYQLSPSLYTSGQTTPTTATIRGTIVSQATMQPLQGATVKVGTISTTSSTTGAFEIAGLAAGSYSFRVEAIGYTTLQGTVGLVAGINNVGTVGLSPAPEASTLVGVVTNAETNEPVPGATLLVQGQASTTTAGPDGRYLLSGIQGASFTLIVSGQGYSTRTINVTLPAIGQGELNVELLPIGNLDVVFASVATNRPVYKPSDEVELEIGVRNGGNVPADLIIDAEVMDPDGNVVHVFKANALGLGLNPPNQPLRFEPGTLTEVELDWVLARQAAGVYTVIARARDVSGNVRAEGTTRFTVDSMPILAGAVIADPPLSQIDSDEPISIQAELTNLGNQAIPAGQVDLKITLAAADNSQSNTARSTIEPVAVFANQNMAHLDRDGQGNFYTAQGARINKISPEGVLTVLATLTGSITDLAVQNDGTVWTCYSRDLRKVTPGGTVFTFPLVSVGGCKTLDVNAAGEVLVAGPSATVSGEQVLVRFAEGAPEQILWRNGLSQPVGMARLSSGGFAVTNYGDGTVSKVSMEGVVTPFATGLNKPFDIIELPNADLLVANSGTNSLIRISPNGETSVFASGLNQPVGLLLRGDGSLLVSNQGDNTVAAVSANGEVMPYAQGFAHSPTGVALDPDGSVVVTNGGDGTLKALDNGVVRSIASGLGSTGALVADSQGNRYVANTTGLIYKVGPEGSVSLIGSGFGSIGGLALQGDNVLHVSDATSHRLIHVTLDTGARQFTDSMSVSPGVVRVGAAGQVYVANSQFISMRRADGSVGRLTALNATGLAALPEGGIAAVKDYYEVVLFDDEGRISSTRRNPYYIYGMAARGGGKVVLVKYNNGRYDLDELDMVTGTRQVIASLSRNPEFLGSDLDGNVIYRLGSELHRIDQSGVDSRIYYSINGEYIHAVGLAPDGNILLGTYSNNLYEVDAQTGASSKLFHGLGWPAGIARDANGEIVTTHTADNLVLFRSNSGTTLHRIDGFSTPRGLAWTGSSLRFVDGGYRLHELGAPGALPLRLATNFYSTALAHDASRGGTFGAGYGNRIMEWRADGAVSHSSQLPSGSYTAIASLGDGKLAITERNSSTVYFTTLGTVDHKLGGLVSPRGLALAADGGLLVANYSAGTVVTVPGPGLAGEVVHAVSAPQYLHVEADGTLWVSAGATLQRITSNGTITTVPTALPGGSASRIYDFAVSDSDVFAADFNLGIIKTRVAGTPLLLAGGISNPKSVAWSPAGAPLVLDGGNQAVFTVSNGGLSQVHERVPRADHISADANRTLYTAGLYANLTRYADGLLQPLKVGALIGEPPFSGLVAGSSTEAYALAYAYNSGARRYESTIYKITTVDAPDPAAVGQIVHTRSMPMPVLTLDQDSLPIDFGKWSPPYAGDFKLEVTINGVEGQLTNFIHVGASASGSLTVQPEQLPSGDQIANVRLDVTGGDFTSLSRVELARLRKVVNISFPSGIASDRSGNIYFTTTNSLHKVGVDGVQTELASGLSVRFGLAIDSNEQLYFLQRNAAGRYDLVRATLAGQREIFAALDVVSASGVAVDGQDNVFVAMPNRLIRVNQDRVVTTVTTSGFPSPRGITIDGKGNIYVQNDNNLVAQVTPDGKVYQLYSGGDGVENPQFEGDGYPNITADCSDNLYIATFTWSKINQYGEEHTIAQIVSRTGHVGLLVDTSRTVPRLTDIDYLAFDRFNNRLMLWDHSTSAIYSIPVTCGAISADAHLFSSPGQALSGFTVPPNASVTHADGRTEYVWSLRDVTAQGVSIDFEAPLRGLALGESRQTIDSGFLAFQNSFTGGEYRVPLSIPRVSVANVVDLSVVTDKPQYAANGDVAISVQLSNPHPALVEGTLVVEILDAIDAVVDEVYRGEVAIGSASSLVVPATYNVGTILPAGYEVRARLMNSSLNTAEDTTSFSVIASEEMALAEATLALDKQYYDPTDRVGISSAVRNRSSNVNLDDLLLMIRVYDQAGGLRHTGGVDVGILPHGSSRTFQTAQLLRNVSPGIYKVQQLLQDADGRVYDTDEAEYQVRSTATTGAGVTGQINAVPLVATIGETINLDALASNTGNADLATGQLVIRVLDIGGETVRQTWEQPANLPVGGMQSFKPTWSSVGAPAGDYAATLTLQLGGDERLLASTSFRLNVPSFKLDLDQRLAPGRNLLVFVSCQPADQPDPACAERKAQQIEVLLSDLHVPHMLAKSVEEFRFLMRSGEYDAYWISGGTMHLGHLLANELLEAVFRGDGLIVDGDHDPRNGLLDAALGVKYEGGLPTRQQTVTMAEGPVFATGQFDISDRSIRFDAVGATTHGRFSNGDSAVLTYAFGKGRTSTFSFDFVTSIAGSTSASFMKQVLGSAINHVLLDQPDGFAAGQLVGILTTVTNQAGETPAWLKVEAEAPLSIDGTAPPAQLSGLTEASWRFDLAPAQERQFMSWMRAPDFDGAYTVRATAGYGSDVGANSLASVETGVVVMSSATLEEQLEEALSELRPLRAHERNARERAISEVATARAYAASGKYGPAIESLMRARDLLLGITTVDVSEARLALSHYLAFVERKSTQH